MLSLTRKTEYALIAVCHLARNGTAVVSARDISERYNVPLPLLMNVLKTLQRGGLVTSVRGARGGYSLAVRAEKLTLDALVEAVEGPVRVVRCAPSSAGVEPACELLGTCPIRRPVHRLHERLRQFLVETTVADLAFDACFGGSEPPYQLQRVMAQ